jgi:hypothetical protein
MVEYSARIEEFDKGVAEARDKDMEYERSGGEPIILSRYIALGLFLSNEYLEWRDKALNEGLETLSKESLSGEQQQSTWRDQYSRSGQEASEKITDFIKEDKAPNLRKFGEEIASQESQLFNLIAGADLPFYQGEIQRHTAEFYKEENILEGILKEMTEQSRSIQERASETSRDVLRVFDEVVKEMVTEERSGEETAKSVTSLAKKSPGVPLALKAVFIAGDKMLEKADRLKKSMAELSSAYMDAYEREEPIIIIFAKTREAVRDFLAKTNLDTAISGFNSANESSKGLADKCPTPRQREDAKRFMEKAAGLTSQFLEKFKEEYTDFVDKNRGIFVGPVSDATLDGLLERQDEQKSWEELESFNIQTKLKEVYDDVRRWPDVDLDGLTDEQKEEFHDFFKMELERVAQGVYEITEGSLWERIRKSHVEDRSKLEEEVRSSKGGLE